MSPKVLRMVIAYLGSFILLSLVPALPSVIKTFENLPPMPTLVIDQLGDLLLGLTALLFTGLLVVSIRRRRRVGRAPGFEQVLAQQQSRCEPVQPAARMSYPARPEPSARIAIRTNSELQTRIRQGATKGERAPALARRHSLSVDAIRLAIGEPLPATAASRGRSFRPRQSSLPASPAARALPDRRTSYGALA